MIQCHLYQLKAKAAKRGSESIMADRLQVRERFLVAIEKLNLYTRSHEAPSCLAFGKRNYFFESTVRSNPQQPCSGSNN